MRADRGGTISAYEGVGDAARSLDREPESVQKTVFEVRMNPMQLPLCPQQNSRELE